MSKTSARRSPSPHPLELPIVDEIGLDSSSFLHLKPLTQGSHDSTSESSHDSLVISNISTYSNPESSTSPASRKRSFDSTFSESETESAEPWEYFWQANDSVLPSIETDEEPMGTIASSEDVEPRDSSTDSLLSESSLMSQTIETPTSVQSQDTSDQVDEPMQPGRNDTLDTTCEPHPVVMQALAPRIGHLNRENSFELSGHLDTCSCWQTLQSKFIREERYFHEMGKDSESLVAIDGKNFVLADTLWTPIHLLHPWKRSLEHEKILRGAPVWKVQEVCERLWNQVYQINGLIEDETTAYKDKYFLARRAVMFPKYHQAHLRWLNHIRFKEDVEIRNDVYRDTCRAAVEKYTPVQSQWELESSKKLLWTVVRVEKEVHKAYIKRQLGEIREREIMDLVGFCESLLSTSHGANPMATRAPWTPAPRWIEGQRGWTGLKPEDLEQEQLDRKV